MTAPLRKTVEQELLERPFSLHDFAYLELRAARAYLQRRVEIALVKWEHGLLTADEQDALLLEAAELEESINLWSAYRCA